MFPLLVDGLPEPLRGRDPSSLLVFPPLSNLSSSSEAPEAAREEQEAWTEMWFVSLLLNLAGYATVLLPGYLFILYTRRTGYLERAGRRRGFVFLLFNQPMDQNPKPQSTNWESW